MTVVAFGALMWKTCAQSHRFGLGRVGGGRGDTIGGGGGRRTENRDHIYIYILLFFTYLYHNVVQTSEDGRRESRGEANVLSCLSDEA